MSPQTRIRRAGALMLVVLMCGCATGQMGANYRPIIDSKGVYFNQY